MKLSLIITAVLCIGILQNLQAQDRTFSSQLPIVYISTKGASIPDDPKIEASMQIAWNADGSENSTDDVPNHFNGKIGIEIRGSSSQMFPKKSYGFELKDEAGEDMDFPLLNLPEEEDWILYAPYSDKTLMRNMLTFTLARKFSDVYVPRCRYVELFLNDKYEGVYVLMEKIKRDKDRVDIAKLKEADIEGSQLTGGYIVKIDKKTGSGGDGWESSHINANGSHTFYQYDYPKARDIQEEQKKYIRRYVRDFEEAVYNNWHDEEKGYQNYMIQESFFDYIIMNELSKNVDGYRLSTYLHKGKDEKLNAGPIWDFNLAFGNADYYKGWQTYGLLVNTNLGNDHWQIPFWWKKLMGDIHFVNPLKCRWETLREDVLSEENIMQVIDSLENNLGDAVDRNFDRWPIFDHYVWPNYYIGKNYDSELSWMKDWIAQRISNLDNILPGTCGEIPVEPPTEDVYSVFPNPFQDQLKLNIISKMNLTYHFELFTINGTKVNEREFTVETGENNFAVSTNNLGSGVYFYRLLKADAEVAVGKVIKL